MATVDILSAVKARDWQAANQAFAQTMQQKLADALAAQRKQVFKEDLGFDTSTVQRVYDENQDVMETELLCNVTNLKVNASGQVVSFANKG
jgi:catabolite regulation protein CreA